MHLHAENGRMIQFTLYVHRLIKEQFNVRSDHSDVEWSETYSDTVRCTVDRALYH